LKGKIKYGSAGGPCPTCGVDLAALECALCGNVTWRQKVVKQEKCRDFHYHITPTTAKMLAERKARLGPGVTYEGALRTILRDYDTYSTMQKS